MRQKITEPLLCLGPWSRGNDERCRPGAGMCYLGISSSVQPLGAVSEVLFRRVWIDILLCSIQAGNAWLTPLEFWLRHKEKKSQVDRKWLSTPRAHPSGNHYLHRQ